MKITKMIFKDDDPILAGLTLDLCKDDGNPYDNIVIVGENGIGKTTILKAIYNVFHDDSFDFEKIEYIESGKSYVAEYKEKESFLVLSDGQPNAEIKFNHKYKPIVGEIFSLYENDDIVNPTIRKALFSHAASDFEKNGLKESIYTIVRNNIETIQRQDNESYRNHNKILEVEGKSLLTVTDFEKNYSNIYRFKIAFNKVFEGQIQLDGIETKTDNTLIHFSKNSGTPIDIDNLSTGEKQIVFRGTYLLSNSENTDVILVDEPELSMHPKWLDKILPFYKDLVTTEIGEQKTQIFFATHSNLILSSAFEDSNTKIICLTKDGNFVKSEQLQEKLLPTTTIAEIQYIVFGIYSEDYHIQLYGQINTNIAINNNVDVVSISDTDTSISSQVIYQSDPSYAKQYAFQKGNRTITYSTLPTYIRNCIDHPGAINPITGDKNSYTKEELQKSIELLRELLKIQKNNTYIY